MTDEPITPALTPEEWAMSKKGKAPRHDLSVWLNPRSPGVLDVDTSGGEYGASELDAHPLAALALYEQPFGFIDDDVLFLRQVAKRAEHDGLPARSDHLDSIADRIAALLPPR